MTLLLDTQVALWWLMGSRRLGRSAREHIAAAHCHLSTASIWEVAIKHRLGKLPITARRFRDELVEAGLAVLPIHDEHAILSGNIALGHSDPFDRLLLATAIIEKMRLATADAALIEAAEDDPALPVFGVV